MIDAETLTREQILEMQKYADSLKTSCEIALRALDGKSTRSLKPAFLKASREFIAKAFNARHGR